MVSLATVSGPLHKSRESVDPRAPVRLLWTGGWDSSFRLLQLLLVDRRPVQPIYVLSPTRDSAPQEIRAMQAIRAGVLPRLEESVLLYPTEVHLERDYSPSPRLAAAFEAVTAREHIGSQYLFLAAVAEARGWEGVEIGVISTDRWGGAEGSPASELFRFWSFPLLHLPKSEMGRIAREHGFYDLLAQRWFCHTPLWDRPCGVCRPCRTAHSEGVRFAPLLPVLIRRAWRDPRIRPLRRRLASALGRDADQREDASGGVAGATATSQWGASA